MIKQVTDLNEKCSEMYMKHSYDIRKLLFFIRLLFGLFPLEILFQLSFKGNNPTCRKTFMKFLQQERLGPISCNITLQYRDKMLKGPLQLNFGTRPFPDKMVTRYQQKKKTSILSHPYCQNMSFLGCAIYHARSLFCIEIISCTTFLT